MKKEYLINFNLFCSRRRFNLEKWIESTDRNSYQDLEKLLINLSVCPPSEDFFISVKSKVDKQKELEKSKNTKKTVKSTKRRKKNEKDSI